MAQSSPTGFGAWLATSDLAGALGANGGPGVSRVLTNGAFGRVLTMQKREDPKKMLERKTQKLNDFLRGNTKMSPAESLALRNEVDALNEFINPGQAAWTAGLTPDEQAYLYDEK